MIFGESYDLPQERRFVTVDQKVLDALVGKYELAPGVFLSITQQRGRLLGELPGQPQFELRPESAEKFFVKEAGTEIHFVMENNHEPTHLLLKQGERTTKADRAK